MRLQRFLTSKSLFVAELYIFHANTHTHTHTHTHTQIRTQKGTY